MFSTLLFYGILLPIAYMPIRLLYMISDFIYVILYHVIGYRKKVVFQNLHNSFPNKTSTEINHIGARYYRHLADIFIETLLNLRLSKKEVLNRYRFVNPDIVNLYYEKGQSVILMSSHYNNWEYMILCLELQLKHHGVGVGKELSNKTLDHHLTKYRTRYGTEVVYSNQVRNAFTFYQTHHIPVAYMMLCDQSPNDIHKCWWTTFLHQDTGVIFGGEYFAKKYNYPVIYYEVQKTKRGFYDVIFQEITNTPQATKYGEITEKYVHLLEETIIKKPEFWLWSHRRWKHKRPNN